MGIEWNWIFQRPQIFAQELQKEYEVTVVCPKQPVSGKVKRMLHLPSVCQKSPFAVKAPSGRGLARRKP